MQSFGAKDLSEDIVQEVYIRLLKRADLNKLFKNGNVIKGSLNKSYVYFCLKNLWIDKKRKQRINRENKNRIELVYYNDFQKSKSFNYNNFFNPDNDEDFIQIGQLNEFDKDEEIKLKLNKYEIILERIEEEISTWHWYDYMLFKIYVDSGKSIRTLAKETKISRDSIFQTLKNCKERIKIAVGEDWEDFKNLDYDKIQ